MRTNFVLIDSENVKPEYIEKLVHKHFRVVVFVGANMNRLDFQIANAVQSLGSNANYVKVSGHGPDALDFHIAYYIGRLSASYPDAYFHIISKDKGFDPLIAHLRERKIFCCRSASVLDIPLVRSSALTPIERATEFYEKRIARTKARPATLNSLQSTIVSHFHKMLTTEEVAQVLEALSAARHVIVKGTKVEYLERGRQAQPVTRQNNGPKKVKTKNT